MAIERIKLRAAVKIFFTQDPGMLKASERTRRGYQRSLDALIRVTGSQVSAYELKPEHFDLAMVDLREGASAEDNARRRRVGYSPRTGRSNGSLNNDITAFRTFVRFCHRREYLTANRNPVIHLKTVTWKPKKTIEDVVVQPDENVISGLLQAAGERHPRDRATVALGLYGGLRESELLALRVSGIDLVKAEIRVWRTKQQAWHVVPMHPDLAEEMATYLGWLEASHGRLQPDWYALGARPVDISKLSRNGFNPDGGRLTPRTLLTPTKAASSIANDVKAAFSASGMPDLYRSGAHTLRRMAAIHVTNLTGDRRMAKTLLGHADESTTERYLQWSDDTDRLRKAYAGMSPDRVEPLPNNVIPLRRIA